MYTRARAGMAWLIGWDIKNRILCNIGIIDEEDVSEAYIASVLRHKDTKTTRKYIKARDAKLLEIVELLH